MKKWIYLFVCLFVAQLTSAQDNAISNHFAAYKNDLQFDHIDITRKTFDEFQKIKAEHASEKRMLSALSQLDGIEALHAEEGIATSEVYREAIATLRKDGRYELLAAIQDGDSHNGQFLIREEDDEIRELLIVAAGDKHFLMGSLYGTIDLSGLAQMISVMKDDGAKWFEFMRNISSEEFNFGQQETTTPTAELEKSDTDLQIRISPNPAQNFIRIESLDGSNANYDLEFYSLVGEMLTRQEQVSLPHRLEFSDLPSGAYFIRLTNAAGEFRNFRIVKP